MEVFTSTVKDFEGECTPVWLNTNQLHNRIDAGITGFFKRVKRAKKGWFTFPYRYGDEFHGIIINGMVQEGRNR